MCAHRVSHCCTYDASYHTDERGSCMHGNCSELCVACTHSIGMERGCVSHSSVETHSSLQSCRSRREYEPGQWDRCTKQIMWSPKLTPGLFTLVCMHGICYGFSFMQHHESPRTPFEIFYNRFVSLAKVSLMCVYDNACHLDRYYRAREPGMFANARVRIDRLHYKGHCACVEAYNLNTYNSYFTSLRQFNSQANEQTNSELQRVATQLHYMTGYNALYCLKRWFGQHNLRKRSAMQWQLYK